MKQDRIKKQIADRRRIQTGLVTLLERRLKDLGTFLKANEIRTILRVAMESCKYLQAEKIAEQEGINIILYRERYHSMTEKYWESSYKKMEKEEMEQTKFMRGLLKI